MQWNDFVRMAAPHELLISIKHTKTRVHFKVELGRLIMLTSQPYRDVVAMDYQAVVQGMIIELLETQQAEQRERHLDRIAKDASRAPQEAQNPYDPGTAEHRFWEEGHQAG